ncbi:MAG: family oxidoreductase [Bryobacterales bacterium]|nr:family oxidoreductase [Bryobacterales bacterium]
MRRAYIGKVAVITGGAGGLGRALAAELARRGCHIALIDLDANTLAITARELSARGTTVTMHQADVGCEPALEQVSTDILAQHGRVDLLINNAGISISAPFDRTDPAAFEMVIRVNFLGVVYACRAFLPILSSRPGGRIVNVASSFAWLGYPGKTAYAASKAAVRAFSECLRLECAATNIGVTVLYPGPLNTNLVRAGAAGSEEQRAKEVAFLEGRGLPLELVARRAIDRLRNNPCRIVIGSDYWLLDVAARISPVLAELLIRKIAGRQTF